MKKYSVDFLITITIICLLFFYIRLDDNDAIPIVVGESGEALNISSPSLVHFWSTWSKPSQRDIQVLQRFHKRHPDIKVIGVYSTSEAKEDIEAIKLDMGIYYTLGTSADFPKSIPLTVLYTEKKTHILKESLQYEKLMELFDKEF